MEIQLNSDNENTLSKDTLKSRVRSHVEKRYVNSSAVIMSSYDTIIDKANDNFSNVSTFDIFLLLYYIDNSELEQELKALQEKC